MPSLSEFAVETALALGFVRAGITHRGTPARYPVYQAWLDRNAHGTMDYMGQEFHREARQDMRKLLPEAQSAIVVAMSYPKASERAPDAVVRGRVAKYALGDDYHYLMHDRLRQLSTALSERSDAPIFSRSCVDSAPLLERELAERAGLGFVAKNTMLITPGVGSYTLLGVLLTSLELEPTKAETLRDCGSCRACLDACPTQAFDAPYQLNGSRCISYLTIESAESMPVELRAQVGDRIFGCDICQDVCPYNAKAPERHNGPEEFQARDSERMRPSLAMLADLGSNQRKRYVKGNALRRSNRESLLRNVAVALGNLESEDSNEQKQAEQTLQQLAQDKNPMVREHACWAIEQQAKRQRID